MWSIPVLRIGEIGVGGARGTFLSQDQGRRGPGWDARLQSSPIFLGTHMGRCRWKTLGMRLFYVI